MKLIKLAALIVAALLAACSTDTPSQTPNPIHGQLLVSQMENGQHVVELYSENPLVNGFNTISLKFKDKATGNYLEGADVSWMPVMHMASMSHSCPFSEIEVHPSDPSVYVGYIAFQMAQNDTDYWTLKIDYTVNGADFSVQDNISVAPGALRTVNSFMGSDGKKYVVALAGPKAPQVALNDMTAVVYRMESMMQFVPVSGYTLKIDPRMPGMGNHGSPNNTDLIMIGNFYRGKLSLTMTGLWRINLILEGPSGDVIKGEPVTEDNPQSSIFFELEF